MRDSLPAQRSICAPEAYTASRAMPTHPRLDPVAARILSLLAGRPEASEIVIGGYLALQHYLDYRQTHDIDAWWHTRANADTERAIRDVMHQAASESGMALAERRFGDTLSFELSKDGRRHFSFQIAARSHVLDEPQPSSWPPVRLETLSDTVGSKMNALVNRGAPRDFLDVHAIVGAGLMDVERCWSLWQAKNPSGTLDAAKQNVLLHLAGLEARRPLHAIEDPAAREQATRVRQWVRDVFVRR
jgi:hypothetical protein